MKLRVLLILVLVIVTIAIPMPSYAKETPPVIGNDNEATGPMPMYVDVQSLKGDLSISSSGKASVFGSIVARTADQTRVTCSLKKYTNGSWTTHKSWTVTENFNVATVMEDWYVPSGYSYKLYVYGYAWVDGVLVDTPVYITDTVYY